MSFRLLVILLVGVALAGCSGKPTPKLGLTADVVEGMRLTGVSIKWSENITASPGPRLILQQEEEIYLKTEDGVQPSKPTSKNNLESTVKSREGIQYLEQRALEIAEAGVSAGAESLMRGNRSVEIRGEMIQLVSTHPKNCPTASHCTTLIQIQLFDSNTKKQIGSSVNVFAVMTSQYTDNQIRLIKYATRHALIPGR